MRSRTKNANTEKWNNDTNDKDSIIAYDYDERKGGPLIVELPPPTTTTTHTTFSWEDNFFLKWMRSQKLQNILTFLMLGLFVLLIIVRTINKQSGTSFFLFRGTSSKGEIEYFDNHLVSKIDYTQYKGINHTPTEKKQPQFIREPEEEEEEEESNASNNNTNDEEELLKEDAICYAQRYNNLYKEYCHSNIIECNIPGLIHHYNHAGKEQKLFFGCLQEKEALCYAKNYPDSLLLAYCDNGIPLKSKCNLEGLQSHYNRKGKDQGLTWGCVKSSAAPPKNEKDEAICYAERYTDLHTGFCKGDSKTCNIEGLQSHYQRHGKDIGLVWGCK